MSRCLGLAFVLAIAACSADVETATTSSSTTTSVTVADTLDATTTIATTTSSVSTTLPPTTTASLPFPPGRESLEHGGDTWVVVLAGSDDIDDPVLAEAVEAAEDARYLTGPHRLRLRRCRGTGPTGGQSHREVSRRLRALVEFFAMFRQRPGRRL